MEEVYGRQFWVLMDVLTQQGIPVIAIGFTGAWVDMAFAKDFRRYDLDVMGANLFNSCSPFQQKKFILWGIHGVAV